MLRTRKTNLRWVDIDMAEMELDKLILHFAQTNKAEGKSSKTVAWYTEMLGSFTRFVLLIGQEPVLANFNPTNAREFIVHEQGRGLSPFTLQAKVRALKSFSSWFFREDYAEDNPLSNVKLPKAPSRIMQPLTKEEIDSLLNYQNPLNSLTAIRSRNIAILIMLLDCGLRVSEICNLQFADAHIEEGYLKVLGKGNKERVVPIGSLAQKVLWRYVFHFRPEPLGETND